MPGDAGGSAPPSLCKTTDPGFPGLTAFAHSLLGVFTAHYSATLGVLRDVPFSGAVGGCLRVPMIGSPPAGCSLPEVQGGVSARCGGGLSSPHVPSPAVPHPGPRCCLCPASLPPCRTVDTPGPGAAWGCRVGHGGLEKGHKQDTLTATLCPSTLFQPRYAEGRGYGQGGQKHVAF